MRFWVCSLGGHRTHSVRVYYNNNIVLVSKVLYYRSKARVVSCSLWCTLLLFKIEIIYVCTHMNTDKFDVYWTFLVRLLKIRSITYLHGVGAVILCEKTTKATTITSTIIHSIPEATMHSVCKYFYFEINSWAGILLV